MSAQDEVGVVIERGARDWQIFQQDREEQAAVELAGRWSLDVPFKKAVVLVRVLNEETFDVVASTLDRSTATTRENGTWSAKLKLPQGGLYRIETILQVDGGPVEWGRRGDIVHHVGVGDVWVITGQSNAAGYGKSPVADGPELGVHMFHADGSWKLATHPLGDSTGSLYTPNREGANASHSPWLCFAKKLRKQLGYPIGLIPASLGGSPVAMWDRKADGVLFENMLAYIEDAGCETVRGAVWYQGESDVEVAERKVYRKRFGNFVRDLRRCMKNGSLPVITAQLNRYVGEPEAAECHRNWEEMRELQRQIAGEMSAVFIISLFDAMLSDGIHNGSHGNLLIGDRMANVALGAVYDRGVSWEHPNCVGAKKVGKRSIDLRFEKVEGRLHFECALRQEFPFAVWDMEEVVPVEEWALPGKDRFRIRLARPLQGEAPGSSALPGAIRRRRFPLTSPAIGRCSPLSRRCGNSWAESSTEIVSRK